LFYANKKDLKDAENYEYFVKYLKLEEIVNRSWYIDSLSAIEDENKIL